MVWRRPLSERAGWEQAEGEEEGFCSKRLCPSKQQQWAPTDPLRHSMVEGRAPTPEEASTRLPPFPTLGSRRQPQQQPSVLSLVRMAETRRVLLVAGGGGCWLCRSGRRGSVRACACRAEHRARSKSERAIGARQCSAPRRPIVDSAVSAARHLVTRKYDSTRRDTRADMLAPQHRASPHLATRPARE